MESRRVEREGGRKRNRKSWSHAEKPMQVAEFPILSHPIPAQLDSIISESDRPADWLPRQQSYRVLPGSSGSSKQLDIQGRVRVPALLAALLRKPPEGAGGRCGGRDRSAEGGSV